MRRYKIVIIGGGAAGSAAAEGTALFGTNVALIDNSSLNKNNTLNVYTSTKVFFNCVNKLHNFNSIKEFGLSINGEISFSSVVKHMHEVSKMIDNNKKADDIISKNIDLINGTGSFINKNEIELDSGEIIFGEKIIIATGSKPIIPMIKGMDTIKYNTIENIFDIDKIPEKLLIIGAGTTGIELAQGFLRLGSKVTIVDNSIRILQEDDREIADIAKNIMEEEGIHFLLNSNVIEFKNCKASIIAVIQSKDGIAELPYDKVVLALGRKPNIDGLKPQKANIIIDKDKVKANEFLKTNIDNIFAIGDVKGIHPLPHKGMYEAQIAVANALFELKREVRYDNLPSVTYTDPEVYHVGFNEDLAREGFNNINVYRLKLNFSNSFLIDRLYANKGMIKIITDNKKRIIGAHAIGENVSDIMQEIVYAITYRHKIEDISEVIHPYLSHAEAIKECADLSWKKSQLLGHNKGLTGFYHKIFKKR